MSSTEADRAAQTFTLRLFHDFNNPPNEAGFHEVVLQPYIERNVHSGDIVTLNDGDYEIRGRVRCLVAVVEADRE